MFYSDHVVFALDASFSFDLLHTNLDRGCYLKLNELFHRLYFLLCAQNYVNEKTVRIK